MALYHKNYEKKKAHTEVIHLSMGHALLDFRVQLRRASRGTPPDQS